MDRLDMRVSDAERDELAETLRAALNEGRIDLTEFDERVQRAYRAKTYRDLRRLTEDLPAPAPGARSLPAEPPESMPERGTPNPGVAFASALGVFIAMAVLVSVATHGAVLPLWPLFFFGFWGLARRRSGGCGRR